MSTRVFNFSAGPATLPLPALEEAQRDLLSFSDTGASVMEISHRSKQFSEVLAQAKDNLTGLLGIPDNYRVLFLQGGASLQFTMVPLNLLVYSNADRTEGGNPDYILTGSWGNKAIKEAKKDRLEPKVTWDGKDENYIRIPADDELLLTPNASYVHFTSNETIQGVQFQAEPDTGDVPLVCDASSDILCRPLDVSKYGVIYAGAQKNMGPAGVAVVIIREDLLERVPEDLPSMLDYKNLADADSLFNTPPTFSIYMIALSTKWVRETIGGLEEMERINRQKADLLYEAIDGSGGFYTGHAQPESRSIMNVTWRLPNEDQEKDFIAKAADEGLTALKGHRSVGGIRASIYNAMPVEGVEKLRDFMLEYQQANG